MLTSQMDITENEDPLRLREFLKGYNHSNNGQSMFRSLNQIIADNSKTEEGDIEMEDEEEAKGDEIKTPESIKIFTDKLNSSFTSVMLRFV